MAKYCNPDVIDGALNVIKNNANLMIICSAQPTTRTEAVSTYALADVAMTGTDFTLANGDVSGRKLTVAAKNGITVDAVGQATHIALVDGTRLLYVTEIVAEDVQTVYVGNPVNLAAWDIEFADPT